MSYLSLHNSKWGNCKRNYAPCAASYNGFVWWEREGSLAVSCKWEALQAFPYDEPKCTFSLMPTVLVDIRSQWLRCQHWGDGDCVTWRGDDKAGGSAFQEFDLNDNTLTSSEEIVARRDKKEARVIITVVLTRASTFFVIKALMPQIALGMLSMGVFWLNVECGERLGRVVSSAAPHPRPRARADRARAGATSRRGGFAARSTTRRARDRCCCCCLPRRARPRARADRFVVVLARARVRVASR